MKDTSVLQEHVSADAFENINRWLNEPKFEEYKDELINMIQSERWNELEDAFFKVVEFGTGGRRGTTGIGSNRINRVTIGESAQAFCEYAKKADPEATEKGVVIACDTRLSSPELSTYVAQVCAANGFKTYLFESFRSTPELSFAVRHLDAAIGIVISASHNPPEDNGFKAYWSDGAQLVAPHDKGVLEEAESVTTIETIDFEMALEEGKIIHIGAEVDKVYVDAVVSEAVGSSRELSIVYSPLHGAGQRNTLPVLQAAGFTTISPVEAQMIPDGHFPTIENKKPNPEEKTANEMAVAQMLAQNADIAITNDPDADRIGVIVNHHGDAKYLSGNQAAVLAADYVLSIMKKNGELTKNHYLAKTIVTTDMLRAVGNFYGVKTYGDMLVGFKYIGELIRNKEGMDETFVMGGEESYGLLKGTYARDKDGAVGALTLAECAAELKQDGKTLIDKMYELYETHGIYAERLDTVVCPGADGFEKMKHIMKSLRESPPAAIGADKVTAVLDYDTSTKIEIATGNTTTIDCAKGNVFVLECGDVRKRITIRPSGTEPKIKFYVQWYADVADDETPISYQYDELHAAMKLISSKLETLLLP
jgi:phosphomannomutase